MRLDPVRPRHQVMLFVLVALVTYLGDVLMPPGFVLPVWAPDTGIGLLALLAVPRNLWPRALLLIFAGSLFGGAWAAESLPMAVAEAASTTFEAIATTLLYLRFTRDEPRISTIREASLLAAAAAIASGISSTLHLAMHQPAPGLPLWFVLGSSVIAHSIGTVSVATMFLVDATDRRVRWWEVAAQTVALFLLTTLSFSSYMWRPSPFLVLIPLVWAGVRFGPRITSIDLLAISTYVTVLSLDGNGPFGTFSRGFTASDQSLHLVDRVHAFSGAVLLVILTLTLSVNATRQRAAALAESENLLRQNIDESMTGILTVRLASTDSDAILQGNPVAAEFLGQTPGTVVNQSFLERLPTDRQAMFDALWAIANGQLRDWRGEVWALRHDGAQRRLSVGCSPIREAGGGIRRLSIQFLDVTEQHNAREHLANLALHDPLTGLGNRMLLEDRLQYGLDSNERESERLLLMFLDLDDFKEINDGDGHEAGDQVLIEVARRLCALTRPQDTVCRLGGDEFVVLVPQTPEPAEQFADVLASRLLTSLSAPIEVNGREHRVGASIGMSMSRPGSTATQLMREADSAMYDAKRAGKNCRSMFNQETLAAKTPDSPVLAQLTQALANGEFQLHVQPVIDLRTGRMTGGESLIRWQHPIHGVLKPSAWLDVAENSELIYGLGSWVITEACRIAAQWQTRMGEDSPVMHANISARQLGHGTLVEDVRRALLHYGLNPNKLVLELTETQLERSEQAVQQEIDALRELGIHLAADDFGTGYSSLTRLTDMPIDILKIDRTFVTRMREDERAGAVVAALVTMGSKLGLEVVAEGVETVTDARHLRNLGCTQAQGYLWSKPVPPEEFLRLASAASDSRRVPSPRRALRTPDVAPS